MAVYFIQNEKGRIKIGSAVNPQSRLKELLTSSDENLILIGTKTGGATEEKRIHQRFAYAHIVREWFEPVTELLEYIREESKEVIFFIADDKEFPLEIIDYNGERWITRKQIATALGAADLKALHSRLSERNEIKENIHWGIVSIPQVSQTGVSQNRETVIYSYRGLIRVSMASEGRNATIFRDWAENVLYKVMTTGSYGESPLIRDLQSRISLLERQQARLDPEHTAIKNLQNRMSLLEKKVARLLSMHTKKLSAYSGGLNVTDGQESGQTKKETLRLGKWSIVVQNGYYKAVRNFGTKGDGKKNIQTIYIGSIYKEEEAKEKITDKGYPVD